MQPPVLTFWDSQKHYNYSGLPNLLATSESCSHSLLCKGKSEGCAYNGGYGKVDDSLL